MDKLETFRQYLLDLPQEESTVKTNLKLIRKILADYGDVTPLSVQKMVTTLVRERKSPSHAKQCLYVVRHYAKCFEIEDIDKIKLPKMKYTPRLREVLNNEEIDNLINLSYPYQTKNQAYMVKRWDMMSIFWLIQAYSGMRPAEVSRLTINDIDLGMDVFKIRKTKTHKGREVPVNIAIVGRIQEYIQSIDTLLLFPSDKNPDKPIGMGGWEDNFGKRIAILGIKRAGIVPYSLRHSFPSRIINESSIYRVKELMDHSKITTTEVYLHTNLAALKETVNSDPLGLEKQSGEDIILGFVKYVQQSDKKYNQKIYTSYELSEDGRELIVRRKVRDYTK